MGDEITEVTSGDLGDFVERWCNKDKTATEVQDLLPEWRWNLHGPGQQDWGLLDRRFQNEGPCHSVAAR